MQILNKKRRSQNEPIVSFDASLFSALYYLKNFFSYFDYHCFNLPLVVYQPLLTPSETIAHQAIGDPQTEHLLFVDANDQGQGIADLHVLRHMMLRWITAKNLHRASRHRRGRLCGQKFTVYEYYISH